MQCYPPWKTFLVTIKSESHSKISIKIPSLLLGAPFATMPCPSVSKMWEQLTIVWWMLSSTCDVIHIIMEDNFDDFLGNSKTREEHPMILKKIFECLGNTSCASTHKSVQSYISKFIVLHSLKKGYWIRSSQGQGNNRNFPTIQCKAIKEPSRESIVH